MVSEFIHKYRQHIMTVCLIIIPLLFSSCAFDPMANRYPYDLSGEWVSEDPYFTLSYSWNDDGTLDWLEVVEWEGKQIKVELCMQAAMYYVLPFASNKYDEKLFRGTWEYRDGGLVLYIEEDFLFDNQFSEIVFKKAENISQPVAQ